MVLGFFSSFEQIIEFLIKFFLQFVSDIHKETVGLAAFVVHLGGLRAHWFMGSPALVGSTPEEKRRNLAKDRQRCHLQIRRVLERGLALGSTPSSGSGGGSVPAGPGPGHVSSSATLPADDHEDYSQMLFDALAALPHLSDADSSEAIVEIAFYFGHFLRTKEEPDHATTVALFGRRRSWPVAWPRRSDHMRKWSLSNFEQEFLVYQQAPWGSPLRPSSRGQLILYKLEHHQAGPDYKARGIGDRVRLDDDFYDQSGTLEGYLTNLEEIKDRYFVVSMLRLLRSEAVIGELQGQGGKRDPHLQKAAMKVGNALVGNALREDVAVEGWRFLTKVAEAFELVLP